MRRAFLLVVLSSLLCDSLCFAGPDYVRAVVERGRVLPSNAFVRSEGPSGGSIDWYQAGRLELGWQARGEEPWVEAYNFPSYGVGLQGGAYHDGGQIGQPISGYGFFVFPMCRWPKWTLNTSWALGVAGHWNRFDERNNSNNIAIGAPVAILLEIGGTLDYALTRKLDLGFGAVFTHFSNGGVQQPNQGLNSLSPLVQVIYHFQDRSALPERHVPPYRPNWEILLQGWGGWGNLGAFHAESGSVTRFPTHNFPAGGITTQLNRQLSWKSKVGAGVDLTYDDGHTQSVNVDSSVTERAGSFWDKSSLGLFGGYEQVVSRLSVIVQVGYDVLRTPIVGQTPSLYERIGIKYHVYKDSFMGFTVRIHDFQKTERLEFLVGHRWKI